MIYPSQNYKTNLDHKHSISSVLFLIRNFVRHFLDTKSTNEEKQELVKLCNHVERYRRGTFRSQRQAIIYIPSSSLLGNHLQTWKNLVPVSHPHRHTHTTLMDTKL